jgi:diacylglycerol kinase (ATP)
MAMLGDLHIVHCMALPEKLNFSLSFRSNSNLAVKQRCFMRVGLVINPTAGGNKGAMAGESVRAVLATSSHQVIDLSGDSYEAAKAAIKMAIANKAIDALVLVGGDGMAHLGVNVCANTKVPMGIVPAGTGNDSAGIFGMPMDDPAGSTRLILDSIAAPKPIDAIEIEHSLGKTWAIGSASAGFDALVNARANKMTWPAGPMKYYLAMLLELASFKAIKYRSKIDGVSKDFEAMLCVVSNSGVFGGGMLVVPEASVTDAKLDLLILNKISRFKLVKIFPRVYKGTHVTDPAVELLEATKVEVAADGMPIYSDGEYVGQAPFTATVVPGALLVIAPAL